MNENKGGSHDNIWYGLGRERIGVPQSVLNEQTRNSPILRHLHICSIGYYPRAKDHFTYRKEGLPENFIFYCVDGSGWYQIKNQRFEVHANEFFILPANVEHAYGSSEGSPWTIYWIHFGGDSLAELNNLQAVQKCQKPAYVRNGEQIVSIFNRIYRTLQLGYSIDNLLFANMCLTHFLTLFVYSERHREVMEKDKLDCIDGAILYMQEHLNENISLVELSNHYNYSVSRFSSLFKNKTGYAPIDYFFQMKMQKATKQLNFSDRSIKEIAIEMGFEDPYYFSKRFRAIIGVSPKKYRERRNE